jgi:NAD(P)-dependent dehydrogenase (short-subunit alcohol dehydrogenase family)
MGTLNPDFEGETVVVTGGASGIGRAVALAFGRAGATVVVADVREAPKDVDTDLPTHEAIETVGGRAAFVETDVSDVADLRAVVAAAREFGGVDVMVNNAGVHVPSRFLEVTPETFESVWRVNAFGAFFGTQVAARDMLDRGEPGVVVNTASDTQGRASWDHSHYAASKGAVRMVTRSAALELAPAGVRVNAVAPGPVATEIREGWAEEAASVAEETADETPGLPLRAADPGELPGAYLYLASDAASYVTGETVWVDGGAHVD